MFYRFLTIFLQCKAKNVINLKFYFEIVINILFGKKFIRLLKTFFNRKMSNLNFTISSPGLTKFDTFPSNVIREPRFNVKS